MTDNTENQPPVAITNPLLARVEMPGSTFQLPSRGLFYKDGELREDVEMGEVHIRPMSAYDEILLKSPDQLYSGEAVEKVFERCIPQILKPKELLSKDVDFLLVCLRQVTYGDEMDISYQHDCEDSKTHNYVIKLSDFIGSTKKIDPTAVGKIYTTKLDNGQVIELRPTRFKDVLKMYQDSGMGNMSIEEELEMSVFIIQSVIKSVDGVTDREQIREWIKAIPAGWLSHLTEVIEKTSDFGPDFTFTAVCKDCGEEIEIQTPVNPISFFM